MCAKDYENPSMLSRVTARNVADVFETHCSHDKMVRDYFVYSSFIVIVDNMWRM